MTGKQPNFLLISTDQQRADHLGCYGAEVLQTPNIDALASRGTRFDNAYVAAPVCMPNRASILTGRMPSLHGVRHNGLNLSLDTVTFADLLSQAGWKTSLVGKAHFQCVTTNPAQLLEAKNTGSDKRISEAYFNKEGRYDQENHERWRGSKDHDLTYPYYGFENVDLAVLHADEVEGHYSRWLAERYPDDSKLRGPENALPGSKRSTPQAWRTAIPEELYPTRYIEEQTISELETFAKDPDMPFAIWASFCDPHHPFTPPGRYWDMYDPQDVKLPPSFHQSNRSGIAANLHELRRKGLANLSGTSAIAVNETELRSAIALTYGMIAMIDDAVGSILHNLEVLGLAENTIVVFFSDHGDLMGEHGLMFKGPLHYKALIRTPLIWADGRDRVSKIHSGYVSSIDIPATILEVAGVEPFNGMQGIPIFYKNQLTSEVRDSLMIEDEVQSHTPGYAVQGRLRTLLSGGWRLSIYDGIHEGVLHNLNDDPFELVNLWDVPSAKNMRSTMTEQLLRQMIAHSETSPLPVYAA